MHYFFLNYHHNFPNISHLGVYINQYYSQYTLDLKARSKFHKNYDTLNRHYHLLNKILIHNFILYIFHQQNHNIQDILLDIDPYVDLINHHTLNIYNQHRRFYNYQHIYICKLLNQVKMYTFQSILYILKYQYKQNIKKMLGHKRNKFFHLHQILRQKFRVNINHSKFKLLYLSIYLENIFIHIYYLTISNHLHRIYNYQLGQNIVRNFHHIKFQHIFLYHYLFHTLAIQFQKKNVHLLSKNILRFS